MKVARASRLATARASLSERLDARRSEIEQAILTRVYGVSDTSGINDPAYTEGLRTAVSVAVAYALAAIERGDDRMPLVPPALLLQARAAARNGVSLDTVLRRYFGGYALLGDFLIEEAARGGVLEEDALKGVLRVQAALFDRLHASVSEAYAREADDYRASFDARRAERVRRLLAGELLDRSSLGYDLDAWHVGLLVDGEGAADAVRELAASLDRRALFVEDGESPHWVWLGGRDRQDPAELIGVASSKWPKLAMGVGEPGSGLAGWRHTHRQACAAWPIAQRRNAGALRYADVALLATVVQDDVLVASLRQLYLDPLAAARGGSSTAKETLRAYFASGRNLSSSAAALGVNRRTVASRLAAIEKRLGCPLDAVGAELEVALRLDGFERL
jgi:hypothetical protein